MIFRILKGIYLSYESSQEKSKDLLIKTRHYKSSKEDVWEKVLKEIKKWPRCEILHVVKDVGEITIKRRTIIGRIQDITITFTPIHPLKTSIDIHSASRGSFGDLGSNYFNIVRFYQRLDTCISNS